MQSTRQNHTWMLRTNFEQLDADDGKHELQETGDQNDVSDCLQRHKDALNHQLPALNVQIKKI